MVNMWHLFMELVCKSELHFENTVVKDRGGWPRLARAASAQGRRSKSTQVSRIIIHTLGV